jgi:hypothetical protein
MSDQQMTRDNLRSYLDKTSLSAVESFRRLRFFGGCEAFVCQCAVEERCMEVRCCEIFVVDQ